MTPPTIAELLRTAAGRLSATSSTPRLDAELLLAHVLGWSRARLLAERDHRPPPGLAVAFDASVERRARGVPVAYLVGHKEFYGLDFFVSPATLVPRPETELLVELALAAARRRSRGAEPLLIADVGTGTGAIAVALASYCPGALVYAVDLSAEALAVARRNVERHGLAGRVRLLHGDLLAPMPGPVDLIVSNPPYTILDEVEPDVRAYEPHIALEGGPDGAAIYRRLLAAAPAYLRQGGAVLLEIGAWQGELVSELLREAFPAAAVAMHQDLAGLDRVVVADLPPAAAEQL
ncbi:MAG TPA: peptide chain release factor N(5)-glutamine methyltransferase [Chloroflexaceae bacterium]|nr:peptide chain release factor N(5)-glutamine methyltransferase [Chloroflexaceae bacterium]